MVKNSDLVLEEVSYVVPPSVIVDGKDKVIREKTIPIARVVWKHNNIEEKTWERESDMGESPPELFSGMSLTSGTKLTFMDGEL